jgi:anti-sigma B factor antagonist
MAVTDDAALGIDYDRAGRHLTVYLSGELDLRGAPGLRDGVIAHAGPKVERLVLDASALDFCDSSGLHAFLQIKAHADEIGADLTVYQARPELKRLLRVTGMDTVIDLRC